MKELALLDFPDESFDCVTSNYVYALISSMTAETQGDGDVVSLAGNSRE